MIKIPFDELTYIEQQTLKTINSACEIENCKNSIEIIKQFNEGYEYQICGLFNNLIEDFNNNGSIKLKNCYYFKDFNNCIEFFNKYKKDIIAEINSYCIHELTDVMDVIKEEYGRYLSDDVNGIWSYDFYYCIFNDVPATHFYDVPEYAHTVESLCHWCVNHLIKKIKNFSK